MPDLVLLDVMMPDLDGFETLARIREMSSVPVIMLTVKGDEEDRIRGLDLGADDYITKPFSPRELSSRIRAVLRRVEPTKAQAEEPLSIDDDLSIDFPRREVIVRGERIKLRPTEYRLLLHLVENCPLDRASGDAAGQGLGTGVPRRHPTLAALHQLSPQEDRAGSEQPALHFHGARRRLSLCGLSARPRDEMKRDA